MLKRFRSIVSPCKDLKRGKELHRFCFRVAASALSNRAYRRIFSRLSENLEEIDLKHQANKSCLNCAGSWACYVAHECTGGGAKMLCINIIRQTASWTKKDIWLTVTSMSSSLRYPSRRFDARSLARENPRAWMVQKTPFPPPH